MSIKINAAGPKLTFAIRLGRVVDISEVESGLQPECTCPNCGEKLIARKGKIQAHHFSHCSNSNCTSAGETIIHLAAKEILDRVKRIRLPDLDLHFPSGSRSLRLNPGKEIKLDEILVERKIGKDIPDLIVSVGGRKLAIEITVTHRTADEKVSRLADLGLSVLEIDLSDLERNLSLVILEKIVVDETERKKWLCNHKERYLINHLYRLSKRLSHITRGFALHVDYCPIAIRKWKGKPYANVIDDCIGCEHCFDVGLGGGRNEKAVYCLGESPIRTYDDLASAISA